VAFVDAADQPLAAEHDVIETVFVSAGAETGGAELGEYYNYTAICVIFATLRTFCEAALVQNQFFAFCRKSTTDGGCDAEVTGC
jgi:hypothetical protein